MVWRRVLQPLRSSDRIGGIVQGCCAPRWAPARRSSTGPAQAIRLASEPDSSSSRSVLRGGNRTAGCYRGESGILPGDFSDVDANERAGDMHFHLLHLRRCHGFNYFHSIECGCLDFPFQWYGCSPCSPCSGNFPEADSFRLADHPSRNDEKPLS